MQDCRLTSVVRFCDEPAELYMEMDLASYDMTVMLKGTPMSHADVIVRARLYVNRPSFIRCKSSKRWTTVMNASSCIAT
jgi:hypothetical protein